MFIRKLDELPNIDRCLQPKRIINPYTHEVVYAECRVCAACLNRRGKHWSFRVQKECEKHRYSLFVTLTYDNDHIPYYSIENGKYVSQFDIETGVRDVLDIPAYSADIRLMHDKLNREYIIPTFSIRHVQLFFKRLRRKIDYLFKQKHITDEQQKIRYFLSAEYGGKTFRPHYHAIIWYDSPTIMENIVRFLSESWPYGAIRKPELVNSSAPQYVAKYVAGNSRLPTFLQLKFTRPFHVQSKSPCIGYGEADKEALLENVFNGTYGRVEYDISTQSSVYVRPPRSLEMQLLPKCREYRTLSYFEKLRVYSYSYENPGGEIKEKFDSPVDQYCARQCSRFCRQHGITPRQYLRLLDDYYKRKEYYQLLQQIEYEKVYLEYYHGNPFHLLGVDSTFYENLPDKWINFIWSECSYACQSYGISLEDAHKAFYTKDKLDPVKVELSKQKWSSFGTANRMKEYKKLQDSNKSKVFNDTFNPEYLM